MVKAIFNGQTLTLDQNKCMLSCKKPNRDDDKIITNKTNECKHFILGSLSGYMGIVFAPNEQIRLHSKLPCLKELSSSEFGLGLENTRLANIARDAQRAGLTVEDAPAIIES